MSLKRVHTGYENNETYHDSQKIKIVIISDPIAAPGEENVVRSGIEVLK